MVTSQNNIRKDDDIKTLTKMKSGIYPEEYWERMYSQNVILPESTLDSREFNFKHWDAFEKLNKTPIVVYNLVKGKAENVNISCIRAPSKKILSKYKSNPSCHMLMLSNTHVVYIPDIVRYMNNVLHIN